MPQAPTVVGTDPSAEAVESMRAAGATPLTDQHQVATAADLVLVVVVDDAQVRDVAFGTDGVIESARRAELRHWRRGRLSWRLRTSPLSGGEASGVDW